METFGQWLRSNFDKLLLAALFGALVALVVHMAHDNLDASQVSWAREQSGTVLGALLGLITGRALSQAQHSQSSGTWSNTTPAPPEPPKQP